MSTSKVGILSLPIYVVTHNTEDYGKKYVVRRHTVRRDETLVADKKPLAVETTLMRARIAILNEICGGRCVRANLKDDKVIVEWWI